MEKIRVTILLTAALLIFSKAQAAIYYSTIDGGNWNAKSTWSTVGYGNPVNSGTYPKAGDIAYIGDGYAVNLIANAVCGTLVIGQGISGKLNYGSNVNQTLNISGDLTVNAGGEIGYSGFVDRNHVCNVGGNFINDGLVNFFSGTGLVVNLTFNNSSNATVSGSGTWILNNVRLNKSITSCTLNVLSNSFENAIQTFTLTKGTYLHNNSGTYSVNPSANFVIGPNTSVIVPQGIMKFAENLNQLLIRGSLIINGGIVIVGSTEGRIGIFYDQNGDIPSITISDGALIVYGGISNANAASTDPFRFTMSGGTVNLQGGTVGYNREIFRINDVAGSEFTMSGGTLNLEKPNRTGANITDVLICGGNGIVNVTDGKFVFGNDQTPQGKTFSFQPFPNVTYPHVEIGGDASLTTSLKPAKGATDGFRFLSLTIGIGKTFDIRSISGIEGDNKEFIVTGNIDFTPDAFINNGTFIARQGTVTFNGSLPQSISGNSITTFYDLQIQNSSFVVLDNIVHVDNFLNMTSGNLATTNSNILICNSTANASLGSANSYVDGPMIHTFSSTSPVSKNYPIGKTFAWRPVALTIQHSDNTPVTYSSEMFNIPATTLPYTPPPTVDGVSTVRYFRFEREQVNNFVQGNIRIYYDTDDQVFNYQNLHVLQDNGIDEWVDLFGAATADITGNIISTPFNIFNQYFALSTAPGTVPLPVTLVDFKGTLKNEYVQLTWITEAEINNDYFEIEKSSDNQNFISVSKVSGKGNSSSMNIYQSYDYQPEAGITYYRLKQTDFDGKQTIYGPVSVNYALNNDEFILFPTVSDGNNISIRCSGELSTYRVMIQNAEGKTMPHQVTTSSTGPVMSVKVPNSGLYLVTATDGNRVYNNRIIIEK